MRVIALLLLLFGVPLGVWRLYLAHVINKQLSAIRTAGLPTNGEELNRWYLEKPDTQNAALALTQAFALRRVYPDSRSNLIFNFKLPKRGEAMSPEQVELLRGFVALNDARLRKGDSALRLPASRYPIDYSQLMNTPLPHLTSLKSLAELHQYAACLEIASAQASLAASNVVAILALARTLDNEPCLISQLARLRLIRVAFETLERRANAGGFEPNEAATLVAAFARMRTTNLAVRALIGERALTIPYFRMTRPQAASFNPPRGRDGSAKDSPLPCYGPAILRLIGYYDLDFGSYLIGMQKAIELLDEPPPENLRAGGYLARVGEASMQRGRVLSGLTLSSYASVARHENEAIALQGLALTALALETFARADGRFPERLEDLMPKFLDHLPDDPFSAQPVKYRRTDVGYVVYSVGPDRQDNGGSEALSETKSAGRPCDITFTVRR